MLTNEEALEAQLRRRARRWAWICLALATLGIGWMVAIPVAGILFGVLIPVVVIAWLTFAIVTLARSLRVRARRSVERQKCRL